MKLVDIKCPNCGSNLKIENKEDTCLCQYCNSQFLVKEAIKKYKQENKNQDATTISENKKIDEKLYNEIDKYIADYNISEFKRLARIVNVLKELYPHKGLARIVILHYEFVMLFRAVDYNVFLKEPEELKKKVENYNPKSYRNTPPYTQFLRELKSVNIKYAEDLNTMLTENEMDMYEDLCQKTLSYLEAYNNILSYNKQLYDKFAPFEAKLKRKEKLKSKINNKITKKSIIAGALFTVLLLYFGIMYFSYYYVKESLPSQPLSTISNSQNYLPSPSMSDIYGSVELKAISSVKITPVKKYTLYGRILSVKSYLPVTSRNKSRPVKVIVEWGDLNTSYANKGYMYYSSNELYASTKKMGRQLRKLKKGDMIMISGYLIDISVNYIVYSMKTSTSTRLDDNYCEQVYVENISLLI